MKMARSLRLGWPASLPLRQLRAFWTVSYLGGFELTWPEALESARRALLEFRHSQGNE